MAKYKLSKKRYKCDSYKLAYKQSVIYWRNNNMILIFIKQLFVSKWEKNIA